MKDDSLAVSHALRYSLTARVSLALATAVVITSDTETISAIITARMSPVDRYIVVPFGCGRNPTS
jgi:hypothetical protein